MGRIQGSLCYSEIVAALDPSGLTDEEWERLYANITCELGIEVVNDTVRGPASQRSVGWLDNPLATKITLSREDKVRLYTLRTWDPSGLRVGELLDSEWLDRMEDAGYIVLRRPVHPDGRRYQPVHWTLVGVSGVVDQWFDEHGCLADGDDEPTCAWSEERIRTTFALDALPVFRSEEAVHAFFEAQSMRKRQGGAGTYTDGELEQLATRVVEHGWHFPRGLRQSLPCEVVWGNVGARTTAPIFKGLRAVHLKTQDVVQLVGEMIPRRATCLEHLYELVVEVLNTRGDIVGTDRVLINRTARASLIEIFECFVRAHHERPTRIRIIVYEE